MYIMVLREALGIDSEKTSPIAIIHSSIPQYVSFKSCIILSSPLYSKFYQQNRACCQKKLMEGVQLL